MILDDDFCQVDQSITFVILLCQLPSRVNFDCQVILDIISELVFYVYHGSSFLKENTQV